MLDFNKIFIKYANNTALITSGEKINYGHLFNTIFHLHSHFIELGIKQNDYIAVLDSSTHRQTLAILSIILYGAVAIPINNKFPPNNIATMLKSINCEKIFSDENITWIGAFNLKLRVLPSDIFKISDREPSNLVKIPKIILDRKSTILFTSGSTNSPKAVVHSFGNHYCSALGSNANIKILPEDKWLLSLQLHHIGGLAILFRTFIAGGTIVIPEKNTNLLEIILRHQITHVSMVPTQLKRLIEILPTKKKLKHLKAILIGGDKITKRLFNDAKKYKLPIYLSYGSTEMSSQITTTSEQQIYDNNITYGKSLLHRKIMLNNAGDILVKGKTLFKGYAYESNTITRLTSSGWFETGDIGKFDDDGNLIITGRKDNMFISGGINIHPEEIEQILENHPSIFKAVVIPVDDIEFGKRSIAIVHMEEKQIIDHENFNAFIRKFLPAYKCPIKYYKYTELEDSFKTDRKYLTEIFQKLYTHDK